MFPLATPSSAAISTTGHPPKLARGLREHCPTELQALRVGVSRQQYGVGYQGFGYKLSHQSAGQARPRGLRARPRASLPH